ncbi:MAG: hypothetical protein P1U86_00585 [Verrucomicrobiales bacterium]|nr:hypothetical protein [Verrucomicrobiales bacterium]
MSAEEQQEELQSKAAALRARVNQLRSTVEELNTAAKLDMIGKVEQIETMVSALQRDAGELSSNTGADRKTVKELCAVTDSKLTSLEHEIEALALGNPTTVSAAVDAIVNIGSKE